LWAGFLAASLLLSFAGTVGLAVPGSAPGMRFEPERLFSPGNDWEPVVAADPSSSFVYLVVTGRDAQACPQCPRPSITYRVSPDSGTSWGPVRFVCGIACRTNVGGPWQADPTVEVANDGTVFVAWLDNWNPGPLVARSFDHGETFERPVVAGQSHAGWADFPRITISPDGRDVYVSFNSGEPYVVASHDGGATFGNPVRLTPPTEKRYWFGEGGVVAPDGTVYLSMSVESAFGTGPVDLTVATSTDKGGTWSIGTVDRSQESPRCPEGIACLTDQLQAQIVIDTDAAGKLMVAYMKNTKAGEPKRFFSRTSTDGLRWSEPVLINDQGDSNFPVISRGLRAGDFRVAWQDNRNGPFAWNTWFKRTTNGGRSWTGEGLLSNVGFGAPYKAPEGYVFPYGDYFGIAVDSQGTNHLIWGEGTGLGTGGGCWFTRGG
jgi:hypothetical protein